VRVKEVDKLLAKAIFGHMTAFSDLESFIDNDHTNLEALIKAEPDLTSEQKEAIQKIKELLLTTGESTETKLEDVAFIPVESSNISHLSYLSEGRTLLVKFTNGSVYAYGNTTEEEYKRILEADSVGKAFSLFKSNHNLFKRIQ
jgi:hypothetical protein